MAVAEWVDARGQRHMMIFENIVRANAFAEEGRKVGIVVVTWEM